MPLLKFLEKTMCGNCNFSAFLNNFYTICIQFFASSSDFTKYELVAEKQRIQFQLSFLSLEDMCGTISGIGRSFQWGGGS